MGAEAGVIMSGSDLRRYRLIQNLIEGKITQGEAAEDLELSVRQVRRIRGRLIARGVSGILHGLRGKKGNRAMSTELKHRVLDIWATKYRSARLNFSHFTEKLNEEEGVKIGQDAVRRLLRQEGVADRPVKKGRKHRRWRERRAQFGELIQQDTSPHDWLSIGTKQHLVVIVDDATSTLLFAKLFDHDGTVPNMLAMKSVFTKFGLPMASYTDRASWFFYTHKSRIDQGPNPFAGTVNKDFKTQIGRALDELGIEFIPAYSPQAKGRVERANGTLQDRLIAELRLNQITDMNLANEFIETKFIADYNKRFAKEPRDSTSAFLPLPSAEQLNEILCLKFICKVASDNTVTRQNHFKLQLEPNQHRINWHKARVEVRIYLDQTLRVLHLPGLLDVPFKIIEQSNPREAKSPSELPVIQKISA